MDSASYAIDNDDDFYLENLPTLDVLLENGLTVFVDMIFPKYHDMTLTQYSIAKRKPKTLKLMLERLKGLEIDFKDIMFPKTSNTRGSLLNLAVEFGSKINGYENVDNKCLNVIIDFFKDYIKTNAKCAVVPLVQSIQCGNNDAIQILIGAEADFFYPLKEDENDITDVSKLSEMPLMAIFRLNNDVDQLTKLFNGILKSQKKEILHRAIYDLKVNDLAFSEYLGNNSLIEVKCFLDAEKTSLIDEINVIQPGQEQKTEQKADTELEPTPEPVVEKKCANCGRNDVNFQKCPKCKKFYCDACNPDHQC